MRIDTIAIRAKLAHIHDGEVPPTSEALDALKSLVTEDVPALLDDRANQAAEINRLQQWVNDLQSGMYVNCVYCGHRYGPEDNVPSSMAEALKLHVEQCPKHPMSALKVENTRLTDEKEDMRACAVSIGESCDQLTAENAALRAMLDGARALARDMLAYWESNCYGTSALPNTDSLHDRLCVLAEGEGNLHD